MKPEVRDIKERKLIGMRINTSLSEDKTRELWQQFMPRKNEIRNNANSGYYSLQLFEKGFKIENFTPDTVFEKWAAVEVTDIDQIPSGMEMHDLAGGKYAVFIHQGTTNTFYKTSQYIFGTWLPQSDYELDDRAHFEIMGDKYLGPDNPNSEEEVWIPVK